MTELFAVVRGVPGEVWITLSVASIALTIAGVAAVPWLVCRMPVDWFDRAPLPFRDRLQQAPARTLARNALGGALFLLGVALLFLPGQGLLTILLGVVLTDLPLRDRGLRWVASHPGLAVRLQAWRIRARQPPFSGLSG